MIVDQAYGRIATVHGGNGFEAGLHVFAITPQGTALIEANRDIRCNLAGVGGTPNGSVWDNGIQEIDIKTGLVRWEWSSLDHVGLAKPMTPRATPRPPTRSTSSTSTRSRRSRATIC